MAMRRVQRIGNLNRVLYGLRGQQRSVLEPAGECLTVQVLHHQVIDPVLMANIVQRADMGMAQAGDGLGLTVEPFAQLRITGEVLGQNLDGDVAIEARILGAIDLAHSSGAESRHDLVGAKTHADGKRHCRSRSVTHSTAGRPESGPIVGYDSPFPPVVCAAAAGCRKRRSLHPRPNRVERCATMGDRQQKTRERLRPVRHLFSGMPCAVYRAAGR